MDFEVSLYLESYLAASCPSSATTSGCLRLTFRSECLDLVYNLKRNLGQANFDSGIDCNSDRGDRLPRGITLKKFGPQKLFSADEGGFLCSLHSWDTA